MFSNLQRIIGIACSIYSKSSNYKTLEHNSFKKLLSLIKALDTFLDDNSRITRWIISPRRHDSHEFSYQKSYVPLHSHTETNLWSNHPEPLHFATIETQPFSHLLRVYNKHKEK